MQNRSAPYSRNGSKWEVVQPSWQRPLTSENRTTLFKPLCSGDNRVRSAAWLVCHSPPRVATIGKGGAMDGRPTAAKMHAVRTARRAARPKNWQPWGSDAPLMANGRTRELTEAD